MANKEQVNTEMGNLFQNSSRKSISTIWDLGFRILDRKNLKLCNEWENGVDVVFRINYYNDFTIPETIPINGENYTVTEIGEFSFPRTMESIYIPNSIIKIGKGAFCFHPHSRLSKILVSQDNRYYDSRENCNAIIETASNTLIAACNSTVIPESVERIQACAFCDVTLKSFYVGSNIVSIDYGFGDFFGLEAIKVSKDNRYYDSREDCNAIIETATNILVKGCIKTKIPHSVKRLGMSSFSSIEELETFIIPSNIEYIEDYAFCNCISLKSVDIPESVKIVGDRAFYNCGLASVAIKNKKAKIHRTAFDSKVVINGRPLDYWVDPKKEYLDLNKE